MGLLQIVEKLWPLHRTLVSDGTDEALQIVGEHMPAESSYAVERWAPGEQVWTWRVPERYVVHEAYLEIEGGERVVDFRSDPLHIVSYSLPIDRTLTWEELEPHLHYSVSRPEATPWVFKYYERSWGFCLPKAAFDRLPRDVRYRAVIRSEFQSDPGRGLGVGAGRVDPLGGESSEAGEVVICTHICHPNQANDDAAGVASAIEVARRLAAEPLPAGSMSIRFLFVPETIGSICFLSRHGDLIPRLRAGIFVEMTGNRNILALQRSRQDDHLIDRIARYVLKQRGAQYREGGFRQIVGNDEMVINGPGVNSPCISMSRSPYPEYHTSDDNPSILSEELMQEAADVVVDILRVFATNYIPVRRFEGPVFLSGHGLWVDYRVNRKLNGALEEIMLRFEGHHSVFDIAQELDLDYWETRQYVERFLEKGLIERRPIPKDFARPAGSRPAERQDMIDRVLG